MFGCGAYGRRGRAAMRSPRANPGIERVDVNLGKRLMRIVSATPLISKINDDLQRHGFYLEPIPASPTPSCATMSVGIDGMTCGAVRLRLSENGKIAWDSKSECECRNRHGELMIEGSVPTLAEPRPHLAMTSIAFERKQKGAAAERLMARAIRPSLWRLVSPSRWFSSSENCFPRSGFSKPASLWAATSLARFSGRTRGRQFFVHCGDRRTPALGRGQIQ